MFSVQKQAFRRWNKAIGRAVALTVTLSGLDFS